MLSVKFLFLLELVFKAFKLRTFGFGAILKLVLALNLATSLAALADLEDAKRRCAPRSDDEPTVYSSDFGWGYSMEAMQSRYQEIYLSGKRLQGRAFYKPSTGKFVLPTSFSNTKMEVEVPEQFLNAITAHVEEALKRGYAEYVFFPDMGHAHYFLPQKYYDEVLKEIPVAERKKRTEMILAAPGLKVLYHTAEQLAMKDRETKKLYDNDFTRWRYYTRNLVGLTDGSGKVEIHNNLGEGFNTVRENKDGDYRYWGAGFDISASQNGCFAFKTKSGETHYFDISLESLPYDPNKRDEDAL